MTKYGIRTQCAGAVLPSSPMDDQSTNDDTADMVAKKKKIKHLVLNLRDDIDAKDTEPMAIYSNEMYESYRSLEKQYKVNPYMADQLHINSSMRSILVDWLVDVHGSFRLSQETLYLGIQILDRYMQITKDVKKKKFQLVGAGALLIASKYEDVITNSYDDFSFVTDKAYNSGEIIEMEKLMMQTLEYDFTTPTIHTFLCRFLKSVDGDKTTTLIAFYLAELTLQENTMVGFLPSVTAATTVLLTRNLQETTPLWTPTLVKYTHFTEADLQQCRTCMLLAIKSQQDADEVAIEEKKKNAVKRKYKKKSKREGIELSSHIQDFFATIPVPVPDTRPNTNTNIDTNTDPNPNPNLNPNADTDT